MADRDERRTLPVLDESRPRYRENELLICAMQYACPEEDIGFRYENPIVILADECEYLSRFPLSVDVIT